MLKREEIRILKKKKNESVKRGNKLGHYKENESN